MSIVSGCPVQAGGWQEGLWVWQVVNPALFGNDGDIWLSVLDSSGAGMNAAATGEEEVMVVKKSNEENGRQSMNGADPVGAPETQTLTDSDGQSAEMTDSGMSSTASPDDSASSPQDTTRPGAEDTASEELPRKRRGYSWVHAPGKRRLPWWMTGNHFRGWLPRRSRR